VSSRWVGMPAKPYKKNGETKWSPLVEFSTKEACERFRDAALAALDAHLEAM